MRHHRAVLVVSLLAVLFLAVDGMFGVTEAVLAVAAAQLLGAPEFQKR